MNEKELKEIFGKLEEQGWMPMLCDTPVGNMPRDCPLAYQGDRPRVRL